MTAILGIKKVIDGEVKVVIASDSLFVKGLSKIKSVNRQKLIKYPHFIVGFSGICTMQGVLQGFRDEKTFDTEEFMKMRGEGDALQFSNLCFGELRDMLDETGDKSLSEHIGDLVIATHDKLYCVDMYGFVSEHDTWTTSGCVDDLLTGAMAVLYPTIKSVEDLQSVAERAILSACDYSTGCEPPIRVELVEKVEDEPESKPKRGRKPKK